MSGFIADKKTPNIRGFYFNYMHMMYAAILTLLSRVD
jgi:hypothetical protein